MAETIAAITGLSSAEAAAFLEMAGGDVDMAVSLALDMGGAVAQQTAPEPTATSHPAHTLLFGAKPVSPAWLDQGFEFSLAPESRCGLLQGKPVASGGDVIPSATVAPQVAPGATHGRHLEYLVQGRGFLS